jgi:hypothetical protein
LNELERNEPNALERNNLNELERNEPNAIERNDSNELECNEPNALERNDLNELERYEPNALERNELNELECNEPNALERNDLNELGLEAIWLDNEFYHLHGFGREENGFEHIGVYDGIDNEFYHLHDNGRDAIMDLPHQLPDISEKLMMLRENYDSSKDELSPFSPRDREIPTECPPEGGSVLNLAGQASTEGLEKNPVIMAVPKQELLDSTLTSHCERITTTVARTELELNDILPLDINWLPASYYLYPLPPENGILLSDDLTLMMEDPGDTRNPTTLRHHDQESEGEWVADQEMAQLNDDVLREQNIDRRNKSSHPLRVFVTVATTKSPTSSASFRNLPTMI